MSTRCQIGFYESETWPLSKPGAMLYKHCDGYPENMLSLLSPWVKMWNEKRGLEDIEYAAARALIHMAKAEGMLDELTGYGICGERQLHGDIEFYYRIDPSGITVYTVKGAEWAALVCMVNPGICNLEDCK